MRGGESNIDPRQFRNALGQFATGVTIVTTLDAAKNPVGVTVSSFNSVSLDPPLVLWSLNKTSRSLEAFNQSEYFSVHVLAFDQQPLSNQFARRGVEKFAGVTVERGVGNVPIIPDCAAYFQCATAHRHDGGDHIIFVGEVVDYHNSGKTPLIFHGGSYARARHVSSDEFREKQPVNLKTGSFGSNFFTYSSCACPFSALSAVTFRRGLGRVLRNRLPGSFGIVHPRRPYVCGVECVFRPYRAIPNERTCSQYG